MHNPSEEEKPFLDHFEKEPEDWSMRYVYADWLDERGYNDEATRQRKYEEVWKWMSDFAGKHQTCENYSIEDGVLEEE